MRQGRRTAVGAGRWGLRVAAMVALLAALASSGAAERIEGRLRLTDAGFADDRGPVLPMFCHYGDAFSVYVREPERVRRALDSIAAAGYDGIRFWDVLGYRAYWRGREVTPESFAAEDGRRVEATPDYYAHMRAFLTDCRSRRLKVFWSRGDLQGLGAAERVRHVRRLAAIAVAVGPAVVGVFEACNEAWQNGVETPAEGLRLVEAFRGGLPGALCAISCPSGASERPEEIAAWSAGGDLWLVHGFRGGTPVERIRHIVDVGATPPPGLPYGFQSEPSGPGPNVSVGRTEDPETLCAMALMALISRQGWCFMSSAGVKSDEEHARMPGFREVARARRLLPSDVMAYARRVEATRSGVLTVTGSADDPPRCDLAVDERTGRFAGLLYGGSGPVTLRADRALRADLVEPATGRRTPVRIAAGATWRVPPYAVARLLVGRFVR
ncbi:MAG: hypothetical protein IT208_14885 [Chthonomonadales bacterium]|nr:hypothetical protein [Chthonomonadales bacterium]